MPTPQVSSPTSAPTAAYIQGPPIPCRRSGKLLSSHELHWVRWTRPPGSLDPNRPANSAFNEVFLAWDKDPPVHAGQHIGLSELLKFIGALVQEDPFGSSGLAPRADLDSGFGYLALTQRQLAWIVAHCFLGDDTEDGNALCKAVRECHDVDQVRSILSMLAVLKVELENGCQGSYVIAVKPTGRPPLRPRNDSSSVKMTDLSACLVADSQTLFGRLPCSGDDFMTAFAPGVAIVDIAGSNIGGGARLCNLASQDESMMLAWPEVMAFSFFSKDLLHPPMLVFGARRYVNTGAWNDILCGAMADLPDLLNPKMVTMFAANFELQGVSVPVYDSTFVAQSSIMASENLDHQIGQWSAAFSPKEYPEALLPLYCALVHSIGTGPWGAGAWHGSSQWFFLVAWLGTSIVADQVQASCGHGLDLNYYVYDHFCENPTAQCSVCRYCRDAAVKEPASLRVCSTEDCQACHRSGGELGNIWRLARGQSYSEVRAKLQRYQDNAFDLVLR